MLIDLKEVKKYARSELSNANENEDRRIRDNKQYLSMNTDEVINLLKETKSLHDEADIVHFLYETK